MRVRGFGGAALVAVLGGIGVPAPASAGVVTQEGMTLRYTDQSSADDVIGISRDVNDIRITNLGMGPNPSSSVPGCTLTVNVMICTGIATSLNRILVDAAAGNDQFQFSDLGSSIVGEAFLGPGTDVGTVVDQTPPFRVLLHGDQDADTLNGGNLNDLLEGGDGGDTLQGGFGPDDIIGGAGIDKATYGEAVRVAGIAVSLDDQPDDGDAGTAEGDNVRADVENVDGTPFGDVLVGNAAGNTLMGLGGPDQLTGGGGFDLLSGGDGGDMLFARDLAADQVLCGADADSAVVDAADATSDCEALDLDADPPETTIRKKPRKRTAKQKAKLRFTSDEPGSSFQCRLDRGAFKPCESPFRKRVDEGKHTFLVRAVDPAGNTDPSPARVRWKVV